MVIIIWPVRCPTTCTILYRLAGVTVNHFVALLFTACIAPGVQMVGMLNYDVWRSIVGYTVDDMRIVKSYPKFPDVS